MSSVGPETRIARRRGTRSAVILTNPVNGSSPSPPVRSDGVRDIWLMDADGSDELNITDGVAGLDDESSPGWAPSGARVAYGSAKAGRPQRSGLGRPLEPGLSVRPIGVVDPLGFSWVVGLGPPERPPGAETLGSADLAHLPSEIASSILPGEVPVPGTLVPATDVAEVAAAVHCPAWYAWASAAVRGDRRTLRGLPEAIRAAAAGFVDFGWSFSDGRQG